MVLGFNPSEALQCRHEEAHAVTLAFRQQHEGSRAGRAVAKCQCGVIVGEGWGTMAQHALPTVYADLTEDLK